MVKFLRLSSGGAFRSKGLRSGWLLSDRRLRSIPPVTQQIGGVDLIGSGLATWPESGVSRVDSYT